MRRDVISLSG